MEILGDDEAGLPPPPVRRSPFAGELTLDGSPDAARNGRGDRAAAADDAPPGHVDGVIEGADGRVEGIGDAAPAPTGRLRLLLDTLLGPEALGLAGLLSAVTGVLTTGISPMVLLVRPDGLSGVPGPQSYQSYFAPVVVGFAVVALVLAGAATLRVRPSTPAWVRGVAGAGVLLAVLMLGLSGWAVWQAPPVATPASF